jgi:hypothetical protein
MQKGFPDQSPTVVTSTLRLPATCSRMGLRKIELDTVLILAAWPLLVLISYWCWLVGILVGILALKNLAGTLKGLAGNPFFLKMGAGPLKKGAVTPLLRKKGVPAKIIIPKCTDQVFLSFSPVLVR